MFRILSTLAFAVSFDVFLTNGSYTDAVWQMTVVTIQHF
jgi:hypothetical protein